MLHPDAGQVDFALGLGRRGEGGLNKLFRICLALRHICHICHHHHQSSVGSAPRHEVGPCFSQVCSVLPVKFQSQLSEDAFHRLLHFVLLLLLFCGLVRSQLDFFVNSGEEEEETTQAPFLTLDVEVQEEEEVPNGDLHQVPNGDLHEEEHDSGLGETLAQNATSEGEGIQTPVEEGEGSQNTEDETTTLLPVFGYIDPSELMGEQVTLFSI